MFYRSQTKHGYDWKETGNQKILLALRDIVIGLIDNSDEKSFVFRCGGALGIDQMAFEVIDRLRKTKYLNIDIKISLELCIPFDGYHRPWKSKKDLKRFQSQIKRTDKLVYVDSLEKYSFNKGKLSDKIIATIKNDKRNHYMVDHSDIVIPVFKQEDIINQANRGTKNCVKYSNKLGKTRINLHPINFRISYIVNKDVKENSNIQLKLI